MITRYSSSNYGGRNSDLGQCKIGPRINLRSSVAVQDDESADSTACPAAHMHSLCWMPYKTWKTSASGCKTGPPKTPTQSAVPASCIYSCSVTWRTPTCGRAWPGLRRPGLKQMKISTAPNWPARHFISIGCCHGLPGLKPASGRAVSRCIACVRSNPEAASRLAAW